MLKEQLKIVDSCYDFETLKKDSGLIPTDEGWNTFEPHEGDVAFVAIENAYYEFKDGAWTRKVITSTATPYGDK